MGSGLITRHFHLPTLQEGYQQYAMTLPDSRENNSPKSAICKLTLQRFAFCKLFEV
jgi:hypothetical protein